MKKGLDTYGTECQRFAQLYEKEYSIFVNNVRAVDKKRKVHLPEEEDINKVRMYCIKDISQLCTKIKKDGITSEDHRKLAKVTFIRLITINDQRGGKRSKL